MTGIFLSLLGGVSVPTDPYFNYNALLLPGNGTNGAQNNTFLDSSSNNFTITRNGDTTQGAFTPYQQNGYWSNYFDGSGDYLNTATNVSGFDFGTGDFTVECWVYHLALSSQCVIFYGVPSSGSLPASDFGWAIDTASSNTPRFFFYSGSTQVAVSAAQTMPINQWVHYAATRASGSLKFFINGTQSGSTVSSSASVNTNTTFATRIGLYGPYGEDRYFNGYMSNLRVVKGTAVYTSNFTPPTAPLTAISGTSLLTCQSNRFVDNSASPLTLTVNGNTSVQAFSPFQPTAAWSASTNGGSGYFDGTGDYLSAPSDAPFNFGAGDLTIEFWVYANSFSNAPAIVAKAAASGSGVGWFVELASNTVYFGYGTSSSDFGTFSVTLRVNSWNHVACTRVGGTLNCFVNGVSPGSKSGYSTSSFDNSNPMLIGRGFGSSSYDFNGYLSSVRIVKGSAVYTSNFTPPTAPLTAISGTSLLLNFTNAGIIDATAKNDLRTVGNAQISTAQSKFGGGSISTGATSGANCLTAPASPLLQMGTGNFTIEGWFRPDAVATGNERTFYIQGVNTTGGLALFVGTGGVRFRASGQTDLTYSTTISSSAWTHIAFVRSGNTRYIFIDGTQVASDTLSFDNNDLTTVDIGAPAKNASDTFRYYGYIDDLRITKGIARYTTNFTPPTAAFPLL